MIDKGEMRRGQRGGQDEGTTNGQRWEEGEGRGKEKRDRERVHPIHSAIQKTPYMAVALYRNPYYKRREENIRSYKSREKNIR